MLSRNPSIIRALALASLLLLPLPSFAAGKHAKKTPSPSAGKIKRAVASENDCTDLADALKELVKEKDLEQPDAARHYAEYGCGQFRM